MATAAKEEKAVQSSEDEEEDEEMLFEGIDEMMNELKKIDE